MRNDKKFFLSATLAPFEHAEFRRPPVGKELYLHVSGQADSRTASYSLSPQFYPQRPDYWAIEIHAVDIAGIHADETTIAAGEFQLSIPLSGIMGTQGIEVIGANKSVRIELAVGSFQGRTPLA